MKQLKSISEHRPMGMLVDMPQEDIKKILDTGEFIESTKENLVVQKKKELPNEKWTEKEIDKWVAENANHITYYPSKHSKKYVLDKLKEENLI